MEVFPDRELRNFGLSNYDAILAAILWVLRFDVTKCA